MNLQNLSEKRQRCLPRFYLRENRKVTVFGFRWKNTSKMAKHWFLITPNSFFVIEDDEMLEKFRPLNQEGKDMWAVLSEGEI